jgi:hypothetical protein
VQGTKIGSRRSVACRWFRRARVNSAKSLVLETVINRRVPGVLYKYEMRHFEQGLLSSGEIYFHAQHFRSVVPRLGMSSSAQLVAHELEVSSPLGILGPFGVVALFRLTSIIIENSSNASEVALRQKYEAELRKQAPVSIQPFYLHLLMYFWPIMYFGLGSVSFVLRPQLADRSRFFRWPWLTLGTAACAYAFNNWPVFFRTLEVTTVERGRRVFAYLNSDINKASVLVQNLNFASSQYFLRSFGLNGLPGQPNIEPLPAIRSNTALSIFPRMLLHWQCVFLLLSSSLQLRFQ